MRVLSRIGMPIDQPQVASAALVLDKGTRLSSVNADVESILDESVAKIRDVSKLILQKKMVLF